MQLKFHWYLFPEIIFMKKILVPTDFSKPSKVAAIYAAHLANKINASITLLSVINAIDSLVALPENHI